MAHSTLTSKHCKACEGGVPALKGATLQKLLHELGSDWKIVRDHHLEKTYTFPDFKEALAFTNRLGAVAEREGHHPDILLTWGKVTVTVWTHKIDGLTESDFILAAKADESFKGK